VTLNGQPGEPYECADCHGVFEREISDAEAIAEMHGTWKPPPAGDDDPAIICDDCYQKLIIRVRTEAPEVLR
jgi:DNA-directed RNA polymerase subunit RPC12/RpoP